MKTHRFVEPSASPEGDRVLPVLTATTPEPRPTMIASQRSGHDPIRHLLIGKAPVVNETIHLLHNLRYAEAVLWSPPVGALGEQLVLTLNPDEIMRVLVRYVKVN